MGLLSMSWRLWESVPTAVEPSHVPHKKLVIMAWSGDLDKIWPTFILGTTSAAMGMETTIFFTFWGAVPVGAQRRSHHPRELDAEDDVDDEPRRHRAPGGSP